jgi:hypothetical protein
VVTDTWKVWDTATTNKHDGVFLEVVTFATNVCPDFLLVGKTHTCNLTKSGVRLFRGLGSHLDTNTTL